MPRLRQILQQGRIIHRFESLRDCSESLLRDCCTCRFASLKDSIMLSCVPESSDGHRLCLRESLCHHRPDVSRKIAASRRHACRVYRCSAREKLVFLSRMTIPSGECSHKPDESGWSISITQSLRLVFAMSCSFLALASFDRPALSFRRYLCLHLQPLHRILANGLYC